MKKKGIFFKVIALILLSVIISSFVSLSASAASASAAQDNGVAPSTSSTMTIGLGTEDDAIPSEQGDTEDISVLLIILVSMSIFAFGALATKLFDNRITKKELLILLFVLIFVVVVILIALYMIYIGKSGGSAAALATFNQKLFWEVI